MGPRKSDAHYRCLVRRGTPLSSPPEAGSCLLGSLTRTTRRSPKKLVVALVPEGDSGRAEGGPGPPAHSSAPPPPRPGAAEAAPEAAASGASYGRAPPWRESRSVRTRPSTELPMGGRELGGGGEASAQTSLAGGPSSPSSQGERGRAIEGRAGEQTAERGWTFRGLPVPSPGKGGTRASPAPAQPAKEEAASAPLTAAS